MAEDNNDDVISWGPHKINRHWKLVFEVADSDVRFEFTYDQLDQIMMGLSNPEDSFYPEVDLSIVNGAERGIIREHTRISMPEPGVLNIEDLGSQSGTILNGIRILPHLPRILRRNDDITLGQIKLLVLWKPV
ncbi:MAG: FHA domain-containing protein [Chloroflexota bacterium]